MTLDNAKRLLDHYKQAKDDPELSEASRRLMAEAYADMLVHVAKKTESLKRKGLVKTTPPKKVDDSGKGD